MVTVSNLTIKLTDWYFETGHDTISLTTCRLDPALHLWRGQMPPVWSRRPDEPNMEPHQHFALCSNSLSQLANHVWVNKPHILIPAMYGFSWIAIFAVDPTSLWRLVRRTKVITRYRSIFSGVIFSLVLPRDWLWTKGLLSASEDKWYYYQYRVICACQSSWWAVFIFISHPKREVYNSRSYHVLKAHSHLHPPVDLL